MISPLKSYCPIYPCVVIVHPALVLDLRAEEKVVDVYDLTVEDVHEFFANGHLVHNCDALVWAITELVLKNRFEPPPSVALPIFGS